MWMAVLTLESIPVYYCKDAQILLHGDRPLLKSFASFAFAGDKIPSQHRKTSISSGRRMCVSFSYGSTSGSRRELSVFTHCSDPHQGFPDNARTLIATRLSSYATKDTQGVRICKRVYVRPIPRSVAKARANEER